MPIKEHIPDNKQTKVCFPQTVIWNAGSLENAYEEVDSYYIINNVIYYIPKYSNCYIIDSTNEYRNVCLYEARRYLQMIAYILSVTRHTLTLCNFHFCLHNTDASEQTENNSLTELQKDILLMFLPI
jgi:hypothetical protein